MPIRFQVDPDFYDHPKVTGMSDAAFSLWVRAGSFSAAKLTDGFISEDVLAYTLRSSEDVAEELARRGLWRRTKGGWRFHQWDGRNLTRKRVEDDKKADAERKRTARNKRSGRQGANEEPQVDTPNVLPDGGRIPGGLEGDSDGNPAVSVSLSLSESLSVSSSTSVGGVSYVPARASAPTPRCPKHINEPTTDPCRPCGDARKFREAWDTQQAEARQGELAAVRQCRLCDGEGSRYVRGRRLPMSPKVRCDHQLHQHQEPA